MTDEVSGDSAVLAYSRARDERSARRHQRSAWRRCAPPYALTAPFVVLFTAFFVAPLVYSLVESLRSPLSGTLTGIENYRYVLHNSEFWSGVVRMLYFGAVQVSIMVALSMGLALLIDSPLARAGRALSVIYLLPYAVPGVIAAIMWGFLLTPDLDSALKVGETLHIASGPIDPLNGGTVLYAIMVMVTWGMCGYNMVIYRTGLTSVGVEVIEAARVDGAGEWRIAWRIKIPLLRRTIMFTLVLSIIATLQLFSEPAIISLLRPLGAGYTPNLLIDNTAFSFYNLPVAAAESIVLAVITIGAALVFYLVVRTLTARGRRAM